MPLAEVAENEAAGAVREIYDAIRRTVRHQNKWDC